MADQCQTMFGRLGWSTVTVAGEGPVDRIIEGLAIGSATPPSRADLEAALDDCDLVVVENLLTIPMQLSASRVAAEVLAGRPALLHHHDPPWQRERFASITELPATDPAWRHVTINQLTERQLRDRGIEATTIYNPFDTTALTERERTQLRRDQREHLGVGDDEPLIVHPVRAIERKNLPAALALAEAIGATYWLTGPAEEDYAPTLARLLDTARTRVIHEPAVSLPSLYAAADLVVFPSTWEGFGNPPVEAAIHRRPVLVGSYPVAAEQRAMGFEWPVFSGVDPDVVEVARREIVSPDPAVLDHNRAVAIERLDIGVATARLLYVLEQAGWQP
ncbi:MAG: glycosyltransferase [Acidimicrobiales bacterium]